MLLYVYNIPEDNTFFLEVCTTLWVNILANHVNRNLHFNGLFYDFGVNAPMRQIRKYLRN